SVGNRNSPKEWREKGQPMLIDTAKRKLAEILATHHPRHIPKDKDDAIRARYPVRLARNHMGYDE
ncbi:MAG: methyltransferase, partial [Tabrizicola sp.]|nr:methyltransferase [Tabrizicola sp.]